MLHLNFQFLCLSWKPQLKKTLIERISVCAISMCDDLQPLKSTVHNIDCRQNVLQFKSRFYLSMQRLKFSLFFRIFSFISITNRFDCEKVKTKVHFGVISRYFENHDYLTCNFGQIAGVRELKKTIDFFKHHIFFSIWVSSPGRNKTFQIDFPNALKHFLTIFSWLFCMNSKVNLGSITILH